MLRRVPERDGRTQFDVDPFRYFNGLQVEGFRAVGGEWTRFWLLLGRAD